MKSHRLQDTALRYFLEVVRSGSLGGASARLHVATSAISRQIAGLEQTLDVVLFDRQPRGMVPTPAGELLAAHARRTGLDAERTVEEIIALQGLRAGEVRLATTEGFAGDFLPPLIVEFQRRHPRVAFAVGVHAPARVTQCLRDGEADIGLTFSRAPEKDIQVEYRQPAPVLVVLRPDHPLAAAPSLTLARLCEHPLALPGPSTTLRQMIDIACSRQQLHLAPVLTTSAVALLHRFVLLEGGITLTGEVSVRNLVARGEVTVVPLQDPGMGLRDIELQVLAGRVLPHASRNFLDTLRRHLPGPGKD